MNIGARDATVQNVSEDRDVQSVDTAFAIANRQRVEESLRRMLVRAVARIQHGNFEAPGNELGGARGSVANHDSVRAHGFERPDGVNQRFTFFQARRFGLEVHCVGAEARGSGGKADSCSGGWLEESKGDRLSAKRGEFLEGMTLEFLKWLRLIEYEGDLLGG